jgi:hypothetical protein
VAEVVSNALSPIAAAVAAAQSFDAAEDWKDSAPEFIWPTRRAVPPTRNAPPTVRIFMGGE